MCILLTSARKWCPRVEFQGFAANVEKSAIRLASFFKNSDSPCCKQNFYRVISKMLLANIKSIALTVFRLTSLFPGANCFAMGTVIPASHTAVIPRKCVRCTCPLGDLGERYWLGSHQARCHVIESCRTDVTTRTRLRRSSKRYFNEYIKLEGRDRNP